MASLKKLNSIENKLRQIMFSDETAMEDHFYSYVKYLDTINPDIKNMPVGEFFLRYKTMKVPSVTSVSRAWRKIREKTKHRGENANLETSYREYSKT